MGMYDLRPDVIPIPGEQYADSTNDKMEHYSISAD